MLKDDVEFQPMTAGGCGCREKRMSATHTRTEAGVSFRLLSGEVASLSLVHSRQGVVIGRFVDEKNLGRGPNARGEMGFTTNAILDNITTTSMGYDSPLVGMPVIRSYGWV